MKTKLLILTLLLAGSQLFGQRYLERQFQGNVTAQQMVSLSADLSYNKAIELLNKVSEGTTGKSIMSTVNLEDPIGIDIENMAYDKALVVLIQYKGLMFEEKEDVIIIKRKNEPAAVQRTADTYASVEEREVNIQALFFEMDVNESREIGMDWKILLSGDKGSIGGMLGIDRSKSQTDDNTDQIPTFELSGASDFDAGGFFGQATAVFKFFENNNAGEIIASPNLSVRDRQKATLQAGADISIKQKDFAGNVIETFYSTGTIMNITPFVHTEDGIDYILLKIDVERSSYIPDQATTVINKTRANTEVVMLNGEETIIGGLFVNDESTIRTGIPFLKDLPWYVFGLRYIFGSEETIVQKKELVILLKADLLPTLKERLAGPQPEDLLKQEVQRQRDKIKYHQFNQSPSNAN